LAHALNYLINNTNIDLHLVIERRTFGEKVILTGDIDFIEAYLKSDRIRITYEIRREIIK
jgi:hypothetical protein